MKDKNSAGIFALLLGGIGAHKFYLNQVGLGLIYLFFCWTFIPAVISLIEGIIYLTMSKEVFDARYNMALVGMDGHRGQNIVVNVANNSGPGNSGEDAPRAEQDIATKLRSLHALHTDGILDAEEYAAEKRRVLDRLG